MKIYLSPRKTKDFFVFPTLICLYTILMFISMIMQDKLSSIRVFIVLFISILAWIIYVLVSKKIKNYLSYMIFDKDEIKMYSVFNKLLYTVDLNEKVYYHIFDLRDDNNADYAKAICISNDEKSLLKSQVTAIRHKDKFFYNCNFSGYIAMYYNETTEAYLRFNEWEKV
ncbi:MAG: hypothetical protein R3Y27_03035 [Clostridia bacterium]